VCVCRCKCKYYPPGNRFRILKTMWMSGLHSTVCAKRPELITNVDKASENYPQPAQETRTETLNVYLKLQVLLGLVSELVFLQLLVLVRSTFDCRCSCFLVKGFPLYVECEFLTSLRFLPERN